MKIAVDADLLSYRSDIHKPKMATLRVKNDTDYQGGPQLFANLARGILTVIEIQALSLEVGVFDRVPHLLLQILV